MAGTIEPMIPPRRTRIWPRPDESLRALGIEVPKLNRGGIPA